VVTWTTVASATSSAPSCSTTWAWPARSAGGSRRPGRWKKLGDDVLEAKALANLGLVRVQDGRAEEAEPDLRRALEIRRERLGSHQDTANSMDALGRALSVLGRPDEAEALQRAALQMRRDVLPPGHPVIGSSLVTLGDELQRAGRLDEAEASGRGARRAHGRPHR
jgi:tetratricopeptide (TPR) repeat protein